MTGYYVTVRKGPRTGRLLGPYTTREAADANVERARTVAIQVDSWAWFYEFGTVRIATQRGRALPPGRFNALIGLEAAA